MDRLLWVVIDRRVSVGWRVIPSFELRGSLEKRLGESSGGVLVQRTREVGRTHA